ncbi:MAG: hypothetical protein ACQESV_05895 [Thermodesulfobacteriota bacterium]
MGCTWGPRRGQCLDVDEIPAVTGFGGDERAYLDHFDALYRAVCAMLYNYAPTSGHPGGSISCGRFVANLIWNRLDYDLGAPDAAGSDQLVFAAGHKALGLYAMWALRDEITAQYAPGIVPEIWRDRLRLEDLLGFRRNPGFLTPLRRRFQAKSLDGHPTPATPFVPLATGASGVGLCGAVGLALGLQDFYGERAPYVHVVEGEGGLTPGRVGEALASAGTAGLENLILHVDWNQSSIDVDGVCREGEHPGQYVQWDPSELLRLHDWNVICVSDGTDWQRIDRAQHKALSFTNGQPTAVVYRTTKGWHYGIKGRKSHGGGHPLCSEGFYACVEPGLQGLQDNLPGCPAEQEPACASADGDAIVEQCFWQALEQVRRRISQIQASGRWLAGGVQQARERLLEHERRPRQAMPPQVQSIWEKAARLQSYAPEEMAVAPGSRETLRGALGKALGYWNAVSQGAILTAAADLLDSTSVSQAGSGWPEGLYQSRRNPDSRLFAAGGICEDNMAGMLAGLAASGRYLGVGSSYGAFMAPLGHIASRLHAISCQGRHERTGEPASPLIMVCAHAGLKTGEDGPTHADPQALQLVQGNFPAGACVTLTPWEPGEVFPLLSRSLALRPAVIAPFVTRPKETVPDREALGLAPASAAAQGVYCLRECAGKPDIVLVLQGSGVTFNFVTQALPRLLHEGITAKVFYVASEELFDSLPAQKQEAIFPAADAEQAVGITGFTLPTLYRWVTSSLGRQCSLHPFVAGQYPGSGKGELVLAQAGLDGKGQLAAIYKYLSLR